MGKLTFGSTGYSYQVDKVNMNFGGAPDCPRCQKRVYFNEERRALGKVWHKSCFTCAKCKKSLDSSNCCGHEEEIYCNPCHKRNFGPKGYGFAGGAAGLSTESTSKDVRATSPVQKTAAAAASQSQPQPSQTANDPDRCPRCHKKVYFAEEVKALHKKWHRLCFKCGECKRMLEPGRCSEHEGDLYCHACYGRRFGPKGYGFAGGAGTLLSSDVEQKQAQKPRMTQNYIEATHKTVYKANTAKQPGVEPPQVRVSEPERVNGYSSQPQKTVYKAVRPTSPEDDVPYKNKYQPYMDNLEVSGFVRESPKTSPDSHRPSPPRQASPSFTPSHRRDGSYEQPALNTSHKREGSYEQPGLNVSHGSQGPYEQPALNTSHRREGSYEQQSLNVSYGSQGPYEQQGLNTSHRRDGSYEQPALNTSYGVEGPFEQLSLNTSHRRDGSYEQPSYSPNHRREGSYETSSNSAVDDLYRANGFVDEPSSQPPPKVMYEPPKVNNLPEPPQATIYKALKASGFVEEPQQPTGTYEPYRASSPYQSTSPYRSPSPYQERTQYDPPRTNSPYQERTQYDPPRTNSPYQERTQYEPPRTNGAPPQPTSAVDDLFGINGFVDNSQQGPMYRESPQMPPTNGYKPDYAYV